MILSVSRRTDIPSYYSEWFMNRLREGYVCVRNPMNANQVSKVPLSPDLVDCIVFWTKNPKPLLNYLDTVSSLGYNFYFQFTITPYDNTIEKNLLNKREIVDIFISLSNKIGKNKVVWRYDPIILNDEFTIDFHVDAFSKMAKKLAGYTDECIISFVDPYRKTKRNMGKDLIRDISIDEMKTIANSFSKIAADANIILKTCSEKIDLDEFGIKHASCIDRKRIESIIHCTLSNKIKKDGQRSECGCIECIDIGAYNTCKNGCSYCYANNSENLINKNCENHNPKSPLLIGNITENDKVNDRKVVSFINRQLGFI